MILVTSAPQIQMETGKVLEMLAGYENMLVNRIRPYPPNFRRMAASIIDPAMGASTWALGSQR